MQAPAFVACSWVFAYVAFVFPRGSPVLCAMCYVKWAIDAGHVIVLQVHTWPVMYEVLTIVIDFGGLLLVHGYYEGFYSNLWSYVVPWDSKATFTSEIVLEKPVLRSDLRVFPLEIWFVTLVLLLIP